MWDSHLGHNNVAEHHIELLNNKVQSVRSAPFRAGTEMRECETAKIDKMLDRKVPEPTQIE